jgi:hypothetical protein
MRCEAPPFNGPSDDRCMHAATMEVWVGNRLMHLCTLHGENWLGLR